MTDKLKKLLDLIKSTSKSGAHGQRITELQDLAQQVEEEDKAQSAKPAETPAK